MSLGEALAEIKRQTGRGVLADAPLESERAEVDVDETWERALDTILVKYHRTWRVGLFGVLVVRKSFDSPDEVPQIELEDARRIAKDITSVCSRISGPPSISKMAEALQLLDANLTGSQREGASRQFIRVRDLPRSEQSLVEASLVNLTLGDHFDLWQQLLSKLNDIRSMVVSLPPKGSPANNSDPAADIRLEWRTMQGTRQDALLHDRMARPRPTMDDRRPNREPANPVVKGSRVSRTSGQKAENGATGDDRNESSGGEGRPVRFQIGEQSLASLCQQISSQTNIRIRAEDYLSPHVLYCNLDDIAATRALAILTEIGDWSHDVMDGQVTLRRSVRLLRNQIPQVALAIRSALPRDYREFLSLDRVDSEMPQVQGDENPVPKLRAHDKFMSALKDRLAGASLHSASQFAADIAGSLDDRGNIAYSNMSSRQQHELIQTMVLDTLSRLCGNLVYDLLSGRLPPYVSDPESAELRVDSGAIKIGYTYPSGLYTGYATQRRSR